MKKFVLIAIVHLIFFGTLRSQAPSYTPPPPGNFYLVPAQAGETVEKLAVRVGADPVEVAKFNGLLPGSVLGAGRPVRVPSLQKCDKTLDAAPQLRGLKLGMPKSEFLLMIEPRHRTTFEVLGKVFPMNMIDPAKFDGVRQIGTEFQNNKLKALEVKYDRDVDWASDREFAAHLSKTFDLPDLAWSGSAMGEVMNCRDFRIEVRANEILLVDIIAERAQREAEALEKEQRKKFFKP
jgi:hypothetical protein